MSVVQLEFQLFNLCMQVYNDQDNFFNLPKNTYVIQYRPSTNDNYILTL